jgi:hypothetical protein
MCPVCIANVVVLITGATSTGAAGAFALSKFFRRRSKGNNKHEGKKQ